MKHQIRLFSPGTDWDKGLLIGNGRLGASVTGQVSEEVLTLNEETMCYGGPRHRENPDGQKYLAGIRSLLLEGKLQQADFLTRAAFLSGPRYLNPYVPGADLRLRFYGQDGTPENYVRELDLDRAVASVCYTLDGQVMKREYFVSRRRNVIVLRLTGEKPITALLNLNRRPYEEETGRLDSSTLFLRGQLGQDGVHYFCAARAKVRGGSLEVIGDTLAIQNARIVTVYLSLATDFGGSPDYVRQVTEHLREACTPDYEELLSEHIRDYRQFYDRCTLSLCRKESPLPTDVQLQRCRETGDCFPQLCENLFAFGRYLLISSSLGCQLPANLQGIWNGRYTPNWESLYTININLQMNYWPAELTGLSECTVPLFDLIRRMELRGRETARKLYGCRGSVAHHNTNMWADTAPEGLWGAAPVWPMGLAWLSLHLWEHYRFTEDRDFLCREAMPVFESCIRFFRDYLYSCEDGTLLTGPSLSPENSYRSKAGEIGAQCMGPTMDSQILRELLNAYVSACSVPGCTGALLTQAREMLTHLPPTEVSSDGRIREWYQDFEETEPGHRHISHLFGLYPGTQITRENPMLWKAAEKTLDYRLAHGGGHTGWSCAWIICMYARLRNGTAVEQYLRKLLGSSTLDNLLDYCPPTFQIDGNFGAAAAIAEALVQSGEGTVDLLPALPPSWPEGSLKGICLRGNMTLDLYWGSGNLQKAVICSPVSKSVTVNCMGRARVLHLTAGKPETVTAEDFCTVP